MDPDANLKEQLKLANAILNGREEYDDMDVDRLCELVLALDEQCKNGYLPKRWGK